MTRRTHSNSRASAGSRTIWWWIGALLVMLFLELLLAAADHRDRTELRSEVHTDLESQSGWALFVLTNRDRPDALDIGEIEALVSSNNPLLREWIFTTNPSRLLRPREQERLLDRLEEPGSAARARFYFNHGIHKTPWLSLAELDAYLETLDG